MPEKSYEGPLPTLTKEQVFIREQLQQHIRYLSENIGERNMWEYENLIAAEEYISTVFKEQGYEIEKQEYFVKEKKVNNVIAKVHGTTRHDEIIVVGAHYDTVQGSPGADDNASGVAAMLEISRLLSQQKISRTIYFVAFVNEEPPFFYTRRMGSYQYAKKLRKEKTNVIAMLSLESIGYYSDKSKSQSYPFPFNFFYPKKGNFIGFVGNLSSKKLVYDVIERFRQQTQFPSEGVFAPSWIPGVGWSDQWSFWQSGYQGIMVTDTALFRNPTYHTESDVADLIDYERTARVTAGLVNVIKSLAEESTHNFPSY